MTAVASTFAEALRDLHFDHADGILLVSIAGRELKIYLDRGDVFYARSSAPEHALDRLLVHWGLVTPEAVGGIVQRAGRDVRGGLVREGVFPSLQAFDQFMAGVLRERVLDAFTHPEATWVFQPEDVRSLNQLPFGTSTPNLILEGVRRMPDATELLRPLVKEDPALQLNPRSTVAIESLALAPTEGWLFSQLGGGAPLSAIAGVSPIGRDQTARLLYALLVLDVVRHPAFTGYRFQIGELARRGAVSDDKDSTDGERIEAEYRRVRSAALHEIVEPEVGEGAEAIRVALRNYQEQWKPEQFSERIAKQMRSQLLFIAGRAGEAQLALIEAQQRRGAEGGGAEGGSDVFHWKRMELSRSEAQEEAQASEQVAQEWMRRAREAFKKRDFHQAAEYAREVIRRNETSEAQALLAEALSHNPKWARRAEEAYVRAIELDGYNPALPVALGRIYARFGLKERARELFERALKVQPDYEDAKLALKELKKS